MGKYSSSWGSVLPDSNPVKSQDAPDSNRWEGVDRRRRPTPLFSRYTLWGKRRRNTHEEDPRSDYFIDRPDGGYLVLLVAIVLLVAFDAVATWIFLHHGGEEGNPFVVWLLTLGPSAFWVLKLAPLPLMFAYFAAKRFFAWTQVLALTLFSVYTVLAGFHLYWIYRINLIPIP